MGMATEWVQVHRVRVIAIGSRLLTHWTEMVAFALSECPLPQHSARRMLSFIACRFDEGNEGALGSFLHGPLTFPASCLFLGS